MTASDHLKHRTGSLGGDQQRIDISNLHFYAQMAREFQWQTDVIHWSVVEQTLNEVAQRTEAALAQKTRECEEQRGRADNLEDAYEMCSENRDALKAQVSELQRQIAELSRFVTDEEWEEIQSFRASRQQIEALIAARAART